MHTHRLTLLGRLEGEYGGSYPLYQCLECGATIARLPRGDVAELVPEAARGCEGAPFEFVARSRSKQPKRVLGRGLRDLGQVLLDELPGV